MQLVNEYHQLSGVLFIIITVRANKKKGIKMDTRTGKLVEMPEGLNPSDFPHLVEVNRDLTAKEKSDMQIRLYSPCGCGSGKKFKFCCKNK